MSEEETVIPHGVRKSGWPKGKKRGPKKAAEREPIHKEIRAVDPKYQLMDDDDDDDRLKVPKHIIPDGMDYQWVTSSILGRQDPQRRARFEKRGWTPVPAERHDGIFMPKGFKGEINVDGLVLMERPIELTIRARQKDKLKAAEQVHVREQQLRGGDFGGRVGFDTQHETALRSNKISKTYERIQVPDE